METVAHPPRTIMEVYEMLPQGTLAELINEQIYMSPAPSFDHHRITKFITKQLDKIIEDTGRGLVIFAPFDVKLDDRNSVQPDIFIILKANRNQIVKGRFSGVPDLIIEILSIGNKSHDLLTKKALYEKFGVREYWVIDPETKLVQGFEWASGSYHLISEATGEMNSQLVGSRFSF